MGSAFVQTFLKASYFDSMALQRVPTEGNLVSGGTGPTANFRLGSCSSCLQNGGDELRAGEISFYILAGTMAFTIALQPRSLFGRALFMAICDCLGGRA
jgi:hypothetical protein